VKTMRLTRCSLPGGSTGRELVRRKYFESVVFGFSHVTDAPKPSLENWCNCYKNGDDPG